MQNIHIVQNVTHNNTKNYIIVHNTIQDLYNIVQYLHYTKYTQNYTFIKYTHNVEYTIWKINIIDVYCFCMLQCRECVRDCKSLHYNNIKNNNNKTKTNLKLNILAENKCELRGLSQVWAWIFIPVDTLFDHRLLGTFAYTASFFDFCKEKYSQSGYIYI